MKTFFFLLFVASAVPAFAVTTIDCGDTSKHYLLEQSDAFLKKFYKIERTEVPFDPSANIANQFSGARKDAFKRSHPYAFGARNCYSSNRGFEYDVSVVSNQSVLLMRDALQNFGISGADIKLAGHTRSDLMKGIQLSGSPSDLRSLDGRITGSIKNARVQRAGFPVDLVNSIRLTE